MGMGSNVTDYLNGKVTEDAILQNISIGNISMPLNSNLIQGAQSLFGVRTDLKFGKTTISAVFSEQRSQSQNVVAQGGGTFRSLIFSHWTMKRTVTISCHNILGTTTINFSKTTPTSIHRFRSPGLKSGLPTGDLNQKHPKHCRFSGFRRKRSPKTKLDNRITNFFNGKAFPSPTSNENNRLDPETIGRGGILTSDIRDIASIPRSFGAYNNAVNEGFDYAVLESARKLSESEYKLHPQLGYISLNQRLSNDEVLAVAFQYTFRGKNL